jgi:hypothetical protein
MEDCPICIEPMEKPFKLCQCTHTYHPVCVLKSMDEYLINYGTEWQTVPCPICKQRISYHIILENFIKIADVEEISKIINIRNIGTKCHLDRTLLCVAAENGKLETLKYLIKQGLQIDIPNVFGLTPFYFAALNGKIDVVKYLVNTYNVNVNCESFFGNTPLDMAIKFNHQATIEYLKSINAKNGIERNLDYCENIKTTKEITKLIVSTI